MSKGELNTSEGMVGKMCLGPLILFNLDITHYIYIFRFYNKKYVLTA